MRSAGRGCRLAAVLLPLVLAGCSGTRFGEALSRSFSGAPSIPAAGSLTSGAGAAPAGGGASGSTPSPGAKAAPTGTTGASAPGATTVNPPSAGQTPLAGKSSATATATAGAASPSSTGSARSSAAPVPARPAPYRVTILLPQADASAPAEVVTQALRAAGVPFEVETIERIGSGASLSAPAAGLPSTPSGPTVRSAPAPR